VSAQAPTADGLERPLVRATRIDAEGYAANVAAPASAKHFCWSYDDRRKLDLGADELLSAAPTQVRPRPVAGRIEIAARGLVHRRRCAEDPGAVAVRRVEGVG
jgi:hypothetical protein